MMEIMFRDLNPDKQQELLHYLGLNSLLEGNYDVVPLFVLSDINAGRGNVSRMVISFLTSR